MKLKLFVFAIAAGSIATASDQQFWKTDGTSGTWTAANWGTSAAGPFTTPVNYVPEPEAALLGGLGLLVLLRRRR
jgi:hypothetical protein